MRSLIILAPIILIPLIIGNLFKKSSFDWISFSYVLTALIIFIEPILVIRIDDYMHPPPPGPRCGTLQGAFMIAFWMIGLPCSLAIQFIVNWRLRKNKAGTIS